MKAVPDVKEIAGKSLKEVAEMLYTKMTEFIRKHHDPKWGLKYEGETESLKEYVVKITYRTVQEDTDTYTVEAFSEEEAKDKAEEEWQEDAEYDDEITGIRIVK